MKSPELFEKPDTKLCYPMTYEEQYLYHAVSVEIKTKRDAIGKKKEINKTKMPIILNII